MSVLGKIEMSHPTFLECSWFVKFQSLRNFAPDSNHVKIVMTERLLCYLFYLHTKKWNGPHTSFSSSEDPGARNGAGEIDSVRMRFSGPVAIFFPSRQQGQPGGDRWRWRQERREQCNFLENKCGLGGCLEGPPRLAELSLGLRWGRG